MTSEWPPNDPWMYWKESKMIAKWSQNGTIMMITYHHKYVHGYARTYVRTYLRPLSKAKDKNIIFHHGDSAVHPGHASSFLKIFPVLLIIATPFSDRMHVRRQIMLVSTSQVSTTILRSRCTIIAPISERTTVWRQVVRIIVVRISARI